MKQYKAEKKLKKERSRSTKGERNVVACPHRARIKQTRSRKRTPYLLALTIRTFDEVQQAFIMEFQKCKTEH